MTVVILVLLSLISTGLFVSRKMDDWRRGREAAETLRVVYSAQRMFLADNPTRTVASLTAAELIPYLPMGGTTMPTVKSLANVDLSIKVDVSPPVVNAGTGTTYDPSGSSSDSLWDVGE
jgi:hypothetical protein